jgi:hypothetical protein
MKRTNVRTTTAGLSCNISLSSSDCSSHSFQPPGESEKTQLARGKGRGGSTKKAAAIEIGHFGHLQARVAVSTPNTPSTHNTLAAKKLKSGDELGFATISVI